MRFHDPTCGSITVDGHDLRQVTRGSLRAHVATVFQDSFLFRTTIRENIMLGRPEASARELESAAKAAGIHDLIVSLPAGYDTQVGECGNTLSGGERQRIALARALVRQPSLLILDEPASALDPQTEDDINDTLRKLTGERTIIVATHRLASVVYADLILVLDRGLLVEQGSHLELLQRKGIYHRLWQGMSSHRALESFAVEPKAKSL